LPYSKRLGVFKEASVPYYAIEARGKKVGIKYLSDPQALLPFLKAFTTDVELTSREADTSDERAFRIAFDNRADSFTGVDDFTFWLEPNNGPPTRPIIAGYRIGPDGKA
jgi:hypothetical protein